MPPMIAKLSQKQTLSRRGTTLIGWCLITNSALRPRRTRSLKKDDLETTMSAEHAKNPTITNRKCCSRRAATLGGMQSQEVRTVWSCLLKREMALASLKRTQAWKQRLTAMRNFPRKARAMVIMILIIYVYLNLKYHFIFQKFTFQNNIRKVNFSVLHFPF